MLRVRMGGGGGGGGGQIHKALLSSDVSLALFSYNRLLYSNSTYESP